MSTATSTEISALHITPDRPVPPILATFHTGLEVLGQLLLIAAGITCALLFPFLFARRPGAREEHA